MRPIRLIRLISLIGLIGPLAVFAYQSPGAPSGFVNDFAGMLSVEERQDLESHLQSFQLQTSNEVVVVTIPSLGGDTIENYAVALFEEWGIGKKNQDNGILVLISRDDRKMRIEVGYGLEGALTDAQAFWIIDEVMKPAFREERYYDGIKEAVEKIKAATAGEVLPEADKAPRISEDPGDLLEFLIWLFLIIPMWLTAILARSKSWWLGGVIGGVAGVLVTIFAGFLYFGLLGFVFFVPLGLLFDYAVSRAYQRGKTSGRIPWWIGGGRGGGGRGGFGGFGGGHSGGGGASGGW